MKKGIKDMNKRNLSFYEKADSDRWFISEDNDIVLDIGNDKHIPHEDNIEMSGRFVSAVVRYGVNSDGSLILSRSIVWPTLRTIPDNTHGSLIKHYNFEINPVIKVDNAKLSIEKPYRVKFNGLLTIESHTEEQLEVKRTIFPTTEHKAIMELWNIKNTSNHIKHVEVETLNDTTEVKGAQGIYVLEVFHDAPAYIKLEPGQSFCFGITFNGRKLLEKLQYLDVQEEEAKRLAFIRKIGRSLRLETPNPILNKAFDFAKLRSAESIFKTKSGLLHSPGGLSYYAAIWTNDQAEYAGPFFPFLGDEGGNEASLNCYRLYRNFMGSNYEPIPSSIISEGTDIWDGAGDRGDAAMYAYGATRYALAMGDPKIADELWTAIKWCLEFCCRKMNEMGVVTSDSDELENRFPSGKANLATSTLTYGGLRSAADLGRCLGYVEKAAEYDKIADKLHIDIEDYFGSNVEGYDTYRYYDGNDILRSWICLPLTMGIMDRIKGTIQALLSPRLWTEDGLATQAGDKTFWDRATLYGFRGLFNAGASDIALDYFSKYSRRRLLGEHVPYAFEAYPEGNKRHLSAESALYCRVVTEGLFGIIPTGFDTFICCPYLPEQWDSMSLKSIKAFAREFDLLIQHDGGNYKISIISANNKVSIFNCVPGEKIEIKLG